MPRWLTRLLILGLLAAVAAFVASRLMGQEEDFDDFDDVDAGFEFQETPVEIDVPAEDGAVSAASSPSLDAQEGSGDGAEASHAATDSSDAGEASGTDLKLINITGIGPAYEARLQALEIDSIPKLAQADANTLAEQLDVIGGVTTIEDWINQAKNYGAQSSESSDGTA